MHKFSNIKQKEYIETINNYSDCQEKTEKIRDRTDYFILLFRTLISSIPMCLM